jgi:hypothetical protein
LVPDAIVTLKRGAASARPALVTGNSGDFRFDAVPDGTYSLAVQREGFKLSVTPLKLSARVLTPLRIELAIAGVSSEIAVAEAEVDYSGPGLPGLSDRRGGSPPAAP